MEMLAVFLCIAIGHAFGDLQQVEIRKDELKARDGAGEALPPYVKETVNLDQYLQSQDVHVAAQSSSSNETETDKKPSSLVMRSSVASGAYEVKFRRRFPTTSDAIRHVGKDFAVQTRRSFRMKRDNLDSLNEMLEPVFGVLHPKKHRHHRKKVGKPSARKAQKKPNENKLLTISKEKMFEFNKSGELSPRPIPQSGSAKISAVSYSAMQCLINKLPDVLKSKMLITDDAEKVVLEDYVKSQNVRFKVLDAYNLAVKDERELLKRLLTDIPIILPTYKALRKGVAWNYTTLDDKFRKFFHEPTPALKKYTDMKRAEFGSLDVFLEGSSQVEAPENTKKPETKATGSPENQSTENADVQEMRTIEEAEESKTKEEELREALEVEMKRKNDENITAHSTEEPYCGTVKIELSDAEKQEVLKAHNDARRREDATNMLQMVWDEEVARIAQEKANTCKYYHSLRKGCHHEVMGQNMYANYMVSGNDSYPPLNYTHITYEWAEERDNWDPATMTCREGEKCGRWRTVTGANAGKLGCGKAQCPTLDVHGKHAHWANFVVCDYSPFSVDFERGVRCSNCANSTVEMDEKGYTCENELCVPCDPKKKPGCLCGPKVQCRNGGQYLVESCGCKCPLEHYGTYCEMPCKCEDIDPPLCQQHASECASESQKTWIGITCQKTCNTCSEFPRPASCKSE